MSKRKRLQASRSISQALNYITENPTQSQQDGTSQDLECLSTTTKSEHRFKGCSFSPDGSCILTTSESDALVRVFDAPSASVSQQNLSQSLWVKETSTAAYDAVWYPLMRSNEPSTCAFISMAKNTPVHLWDAYHNNFVRASYTGVSEGHEPLLGAISIGMNATKIFAGARNVIHMWDINRPGETLDYVYLKTCKGLVSSLDPFDDSSFAFATYTGNVGVVDLDTFAICFQAQAQQSGITRVRQRGNLLWAGGRRSRHILCFDVRINREDGPLFKLERVALGNQRIDFDILGSNNFILSGSSNLGALEAWSLANGGEPRRMEFKNMEHLGVINGVSFDPTFTSFGLRFCLTTGSRPLIKPIDSDDPDNEIEDNDSLKESSLSVYHKKF